ncbi:hypothetical protein [Mitsuaria sp. 7]|uniref:hypothetical protein n=1 Tax=Mitsuaria sp. 7 TaxID=1658665 RepID=UPI0007DDB54C|nr:hypothetical protein [Mitsuaria sp. 7]ANH66394.1 hypothetical protein ABE85_00355 [Mitsuaria sp. 7]
MRHTVLALACLAALTACSKSNDAAEAKDPPPTSAPSASPAEAPQRDASSDDAKAAAFTHAVKVDVAAQVVSTASEACGSMKGQEMPAPNSGSPMQYGAGGVISWGKGSLDYVKEPGATVVFTSNRSEKTFAFGTDIYELPQGNRKYVAGLGQLKGGSLSATVTDETKAVDGDSQLTTSNLCVGSQPPALATQGAWAIAAKHLQVPATPMTCTQIGKFESQSLSFAFDGKTLQAGSNSFSQADSASGETLTIDPKGGSANVVYSVARADGTGAGLGLSQPRVLSYAALDLPGGVHLICAPK